MRAGLLRHSGVTPRRTPRGLGRLNGGWPGPSGGLRHAAGDVHPDTDLWCVPPAPDGGVHPGWYTCNPCGTDTGPEGFRVWLLHWACWLRWRAPVAHRTWIFPTSRTAETRRPTRPVTRPRAPRPAPRRSTRWSVQPMPTVRGFRRRECARATSTHRVVSSVCPAATAAVPNGVVPPSGPVAPASARTCGPVPNIAARAARPVRPAMRCPRASTASAGWMSARPVSATAMGRARMAARWICRVTPTTAACAGSSVACTRPVPTASAGSAPPGSPWTATGPEKWPRGARVATTPRSTSSTTFGMWTTAAESSSWG